MTTSCDVLPMPHRPPLPIARVLAPLAGLVILKVTASVVAGYGSYVPPDFTIGFLRGRDAYFFGTYRWAFWAHIVAGPVALMLGLVLMSARFRVRFPAWHRRLGRVQGAVVLGMVAPSGLVMARRAAAGPVAAVGLAALAVATAGCCVLGWRTARARRFADHRRWMTRCYLLLASAVVLRLLGGLGTVIGVTASWYDPLASWLCWLGPLVGFEGWDHLRGASLSRSWNRTAARRSTPAPARPRPPSWS